MHLQLFLFLPKKMLSLLFLAKVVFNFRLRVLIFGASRRLSVLVFGQSRRLNVLIFGQSRSQLYAKGAYFWPKS